MFYSSILYYPHVGLMDSPWLKNALLFWDKVYVIMPKDFDIEQYPVDEKTKILNKKLIDDGVLIPITVDPDHPAVQVASATFKERLEQGLLGHWHIDKEGQKQTPLARMHPGKVTADVLAMIEGWDHLIPDLKQRITFDQSGRPLLYLPRKIVVQYMSLLASELASRERLAVGTDDEEYERQMLDVAHPTVDKLRSPNGSNGAAKGYVSHLLLQAIDVGQNDTKRILDFHKKHGDEINAFRGAVGHLFSDIPDDASIQDLNLYFRDCWKNEIEPELNRLRKSLSEKKLAMGIGLLKTAALCTTGSLFGVAVAGPIGMALGAAVPVAIEVGERWLAHRTEERNNPFSIVMKVRGKGSSSFGLDEEEFPDHWERLGLPLPV